MSYFDRELASSSCVSHLEAPSNGFLRGESIFHDITVAEVMRISSWQDVSGVSKGNISSRSEVD